MPLGTQDDELSGTRPSAAGDDRSAWALARCAASDPLSIQDLRRQSVELFPGTNLSRLSNQELLSRLDRQRAAVGRGLSDFPYTPDIAGGENEPAPPAQPEVWPPPAVPPIEQHWIEIELVDSEGRAVAGESYRIQLPDGSWRQGETDARGRGRLEAIPLGTCRVTFPQLDRSRSKAS